jgi:hypothetical protein
MLFVCVFPEKKMPEIFERAHLFQSSASDCDACEINWRANVGDLIFEDTYDCLKVGLLMTTVILLATKQI